MCEIILELVFVYSYKVSSDWSVSLSNTFVASDCSVIFSIFMFLKRVSTCFIQKWTCPNVSVMMHRE